MLFRKITVLTGLTVWLGLLAASVAAPDAPDAPTQESPESDTISVFEYVDSLEYPEWVVDAWESTDAVLHDHLRIGVRYRQIDLHDDKRSTDNSFLGSITELNAQSDYESITWLTFDWLVNPYIGIRFGMDQLRAETLTSQANAALNHTDGNVDLYGPGLMLVLRYPNDTRVIPTIGLGYSWLDATFEHNPVWLNGFGGDNRQQAYDAWIAAGAPPWPNGGYRRTITLKDTTAVTLYGELAFQITDHLDIHAFIQSVDVDGVDLTFDLSNHGDVFDSYQAEFPMSNTAYGAGLRWTF
jgi:hypothetical protein